MPDDPPELFTRSPRNPLLRAADLPPQLSIRAQAVCNPATTLVNGTTLLLLRVIDKGNRSHLTVARSADGITDWRIDPIPLLSPNTDAPWYDNDGCEDPRLTFLPERNEWAITYVGVSRFGAGVCLATTTDFQTATRRGLLVHPYNKDAALLPRRMGGRWRLLHRPTAGPLENIWMSQSSDLVDWGRPQCVLEECDKPGWDSGKVGTGPPPLETDDGWLLLYHGVQQEGTGWLYRVGLALLDKDDPAIVVSRAPQWVFGPLADYERNGNKPGIVFPTGAIVRDGLVHLYYGAADTCVCLATAPLDVLLAALR